MYDDTFDVGLRWSANLIPSVTGTLHLFFSLTSLTEGGAGRQDPMLRRNDKVVGWLPGCETGVGWELAKNFT